MGSLRETQRFAGTQGADIAAVTANGVERLDPQGEHRGELLAAEIAIGLIVPEDEPIGPQALFKGLEQGRILLLACHLA